jgi:crotonobetaine/carnitine-CoA ligase
MAQPGVRTIPELMRDAADAHPDRDWLLYEDESLSYASACDGARAVAAGLADAGVTKGDIVMVVAHNSTAHVLTWLGITQLGAVMLPVNPRSSRAELGGFLGQAEPGVVVHDPERDEALDDALRDTSVRPRVIDVHELVATPTTGAGSWCPIDAGDPAVLIPTSGTTGRSKLVTQTHRGYVLAGEGFPSWMGLTPDDRLMTSLPIFHINAPAYSLLGAMAIGASVVLLPSFSPRTFIEDARRYGATEFNTIGAMLEMLMRRPEQPDDADNPLRLCYTGPSPPRARHLEIEQRFGIEIVCGYGLSESTYGTIWRRGERPYGTLGAARQHPTLGHVNDARVMDDRREVDAGEVGELELRNPAIMLGYHDMPEETAAVLVDGWLRTGDLVTKNADGTFTFVSRRKEVIRRRGENLAPGEVEEALVAHPDIVEAAVIAVPSDLGEDDVKAFVIARPGAVVDLADVRGVAAERLARFKVPRYIEQVDELPRTPTGRVAKHELATHRTTGEIDFEPPRDQERTT